MGVNVDYFLRFTNFISNKAQSGNTVSPSQFNIIANQAQLQLYESDFQTFLQTEEISEYLKTFLQNKVASVPLSGQISYPTNFQHLSSLRKYYVNAKGVGQYIPVEEINNVSYGFIQVSSLMEPLMRFPKYSEFSDAIRFLPKNIGIVEMDYFKTPTVPVWGFTKVAGQPVYNPATSTNFDWAEFSLNEIASIYLSMIGINLRESDLNMWSQQFKQENKSIL